jgi:pimeloyl-ACP methyl ester carboxylesterase
MRPDEDTLRQGWHTLETDGVRQAYEVAGRGPVCVVHSGGPGINSGYLRMPILEKYLTMVYLDPIGTGKSDLLPGAEYFVPTYARYLHAVVDQIAQPKPVILGHSHGGMVALELAIQTSDRLGAVIAYDTAPVYTDDLWDESSRQIDAFAMRWPDRPEAAVAARAWHAGAGGEPRGDAASEQRFLADVLPAYFADYRRAYEPDHRPALDITWDPNRTNGTWSASDRLGAINTPTLIICGAFDFVCPPRWSKEMHDSIPYSELVELHDSGHFGHQEQPQEFVHAVLSFVGRH